MGGRYDISTLNIGGHAAENVVVEIQLPDELALVVLQPLDWQLISEGDQQKVYQLTLGALSPQATIKSFILLELSEDIAAGQTILTPAMRLYGTEDVALFQLAAGSGANVVIVEENEDALVPTDLSEVEEPHRPVQLFLPIIAR